MCDFTAKRVCFESVCAATDAQMFVCVCVRADRFDRLFVCVASPAAIAIHRPGVVSTVLRRKG